MASSSQTVLLIPATPALEAALEAARPHLHGHPFAAQRALPASAAGVADAVVLVDTAAPGFAATLRELDQPGRDAPLLAVVRGASAPEAVEALRAGADDVLDLQLSAPVLAARLRQALERARLSAALRRKEEWAREQVVRISETLRAQEEEIVLRLSLAGEMRDNETAAHIVRMARYCVIVAEQLGFPRETCDFLYLAAQMHDIGKIGVPDGILCKAGQLTAEERTVMERHTLVAETILKGSSSPLIQLAEIIATTHHERWDGTGYPRRLKGQEIPIAGRIAAVADVFDALASPRRYKAGWSLDEARDELVRQRGSHFDPGCVDALLARWDAVVAVARGQAGRTAAADVADFTSAPAKRAATG